MKKEINEIQKLTNQNQNILNPKYNIIDTIREYFEQNIFELKQKINYESDTIKILENKKTVSELEKILDDLIDYDTVLCEILARIRDISKK